MTKFSENRDSGIGKFLAIVLVIAAIVGGAAYLRFHNTTPTIPAPVATATSDVTNADTTQPLPRLPIKPPAYGESGHR